MNPAVSNGIAFADGIKIDTTAFVATTPGSGKSDALSYLSWASALALAQRPTQVVKTFGSGLPALEVFGGLAVRIDQVVDGGGAIPTYLPVLDRRNLPVASDAASPRDVTDTLMRARAKSAAICNGVGLGIYLGVGGNGIALVRALRLRPDSDLAQSAPFVETKPGKSAASYVSWAAAVAAARLTDPTFHYQVVFHNHVDENGEVQNKPFLPVPGGFMVAVEVAYKGLRHTEWLPIMGVVEVQTAKGPKKMDHQPLTAPTVFEWHRAVMRCLAKAIAVATGYGLSTYAGEDIDDFNAVKVPQRVSVKQAVTEGEQPAQAQEQATQEPAAPEQTPDEQPAKVAAAPAAAPIAAPAAVAAQPAAAVEQPSGPVFEPLSDDVVNEAMQDDLLSEEDEAAALVKQLEDLLESETPGKQQFILKATHARRLVDEPPESAAHLVAMSQAAARTVIAGLLAKKAKVSA